MIRELIHPGMSSKDLCGKGDGDSPPVRTLDSELPLPSFGMLRGAGSRASGYIHHIHTIPFFRTAHIMFADVFIGKNFQKLLLISHSLQAPHPLLHMWNFPQSIKMLKTVSKNLVFLWPHNFCLSSLC